MSVLGKICIKKYLQDKKGVVTGRITTDGKSRSYRNEYKIRELEDGNIAISQSNDKGDTFIMPAEVELTEAMVAFFGLYSGDGSKGTEDRNKPDMIKPSISFSQKEPNLVKFAVQRFQELFAENIAFRFSLGEDSAYFMDGEGEEKLKNRYGGELPSIPALRDVKCDLNKGDEMYLSEVRNVSGTNEEHLAFYYYFKRDMEEILSEQKKEEIRASGLTLGDGDKVSASLRRPFKKGARQPGGSSRSDEIYLKGLNGAGELFLRILHELEQSIYDNKKISAFGLIEWEDIPDRLGIEIDIENFFTDNPYGVINDKRPQFIHSGIKLLGKWSGSAKKTELKKKVKLDPLMCYVSGLYLAEGSTPKEKLFSMFKNKAEKFSMGFTSTENENIELVLRALRKLFNAEDCLSTWKVKVGSQYFTELVVIGLKNGVPVLRGGKSGDGKMRTMEISLAIKQWALDVAPCLQEYSSRYSHVEPTGAGIARIDFCASSSLCRWFFPVMMYAVFGETYGSPIWK